MLGSTGIKPTSGDIDIAVDANTVCNPTISNTGPTMPPLSMASKSQRHSIALKETLDQPRSRTKRANPKPMPLPKYNRPPSSSGGTSPTNNLASGVLAPNNPAASKAEIMAGLSVIMRIFYVGISETF
jgi:hypothetical protein